MKIAIALERLSLSGGLFRFERFGKLARTLGHEIAYIALADKCSPDRSTGLALLSLAQANERRWDAVMAPGAGFSAPVIERFDRLRTQNFGRRIQHVLNDQSRADRFIALNRAFAPHLVVFNNRHWGKQDVHVLAAERHEWLEGAVDTHHFQPPSSRSWPRTGDRLTIGGIANKNPAPLIEAASMLGADIQLFGQPKDPSLARQANLLGPLDDDGLKRFYGAIDILVHTEQAGGWANIVAEAMASGVPVICTPNGTLALARHEHTALVLPRPDPGRIAEAAQRLLANPDFTRKMVLEARRHVEQYDWAAYTHKLLKLCAGDD